MEGVPKFRDTIELVLRNFLEVISLPIINRVGLRYVDECPVPSNENSAFKSYYNSVFPLDRFGLPDVQEMAFKTMIKRDNYFLHYVEALQKIQDKYKYILDFDGSALNVNPKDYLTVTDKLHDLISVEYEKTIKEPVKEYMRKLKEA